jgi:hypothetical protein
MEWRLRIGLRQFIEQRPGMTDGAFHLPQSVPAMKPGLVDG